MDIRPKNILLISLFFFLLILSTKKSSAQQASSVQKYIKVPTGYLMVLQQGDSIVNELERVTVKENIPSANITGMGFVNVTFGFFDSQTKKFIPKTFNDVELASMNGTIAWQNGKPSLHLHGVVGDRDFNTFGGHILEGTVGTGSLEIMIVLHDKKLERVFEEGLGANVLHLH